MSLDELKKAIRNSSDLSELKRLVGPSDDEKEEHRDRIDRYDQLGQKYGYNDHRVKSIGMKIAEFERTYC